MSLGKKTVEYIINYNNINDENKKEILIYGAEVFFGTVVSVFGTLVISYVIDLHSLVFFMLLASILIRKTAGGAHSENSVNCLLITVLVYNLLAYLAFETIIYVQMYLFTIILSTCSIGLILVILKAPVESPQKPLGNEQKRLLRKLAVLAVIFIFSLQLISFYTNSLVNYAISLILMWHYFMLTSYGHKFIAFIDKGLGLCLNKRG